MKTALQIGLTALLVGALAFYGGVMYGRASGRAGLGAATAAGRRLRPERVRPARPERAERERERGTDARRVRERRGHQRRREVDHGQDGRRQHASTVYFDTNTRVVRSSEATLTDLDEGRDGRRGGQRR